MNATELSPAPVLKNIRCVKPRRSAAAALLLGAAALAVHAEDIEFRPMLPVTGLCDLREAYSSGLDSAVLSRPTSQAIAGQAFLVRNAAHPWLFARTRFDEPPMKVSMYECGTSRYWKNSVDCGMFGAGDPTANRLWQPEDCSWTSATLSYGENTFFTISLLAPAFLLETSESNVFFMRPTNYRYAPDIESKWQQWRKADWRLAGRPNIPGQAELVPELKPVYLALASGGAIKIFSAVPAEGLRELPSPAPTLDEPWLLVWSGNRKPIEVPPPNCGNWPAYKADMPWLFILQRRPADITMAPEEGLFLEFPREAGVIVGLPLFGNRLPAAMETEEWTKGVPAEIAALCRQWTKYLRYFPTGVAEKARLTPAGDVVLSESFEYREIRDDWGTAGVKAAFLPPMATPAAVCAEAITCSLTPRSMEAATFFGEVQLVEAEQYEITIKTAGLFNKTRRPKNGAPLPAAAQPVQDALYTETDWVLQHGHLAPFFPFVQKLWAQEWMHVYPCWRRPEAMLRALMYAWPHLDTARQAKMRDYLRAEFERYPPLTTGSLPPDDGLRRESFPCQEHLWAAPEYTELIAPHKKQLASVVPPTWYALWLYAEQTGDWEYIRAQRNDFREQILDLASYSQWHTLGLLRPPAFDLSGSAGDINGAVAGFLGAARLARGIGEADLEELSLIMAAKMLLLRLVYENYHSFMWERLTARALRSGDYPDKTVVNAAARSGAPFHVRELDDFGPAVWQNYGPFNQTGIDATLMHLCPELAAALKRFAPEAVQSYEDYVRREYVLWHCSKIFPFPVRWEENPFAAPQISWTTFNMYAWVFDWDGPALQARLDIPWCRGDWFYIEKLAHTLTAYKGWEWIETGK